MPIYDFMTDDGEIVEALLPMAESGSIGDIMTVTDPDTGEDILATRLPNPPQVLGDNWKPYISNRLPRNLEGVPCTPSGKPIVTTKAQERDICSKFHYERE